MLGAEPRFLHFVMFETERGTKREAIVLCETPEERMRNALKDTLQRALPKGMKVKKILHEHLVQEDVVLL